MSKDTSFVEYIIYDVLGHIPEITSRGMFSGHGIYLDSVIIALIIDGELYFKVDKELKEKYIKDGYHPFSYDRNGKMVDLAYISVTAEDLENREEIDRRVEESYQISAGGK
jgi:DNA transformation protein and related proteins